MMKKITYIIVFFSFLITACTSDADSKKIAEDILGDDLDSLSFDEIKQSIAEGYVQFSMFNAFFGNTDDDKPEKYEESDERCEDFYTLSQVYNEEDFVQGVRFSQSLNYPNSVLKIDSDVKEADSDQITYFLDRIYYNDQTSDSLDTSISSRHTLDMRKVDSVKVTIRYSYVTQLDEVELTASSKNVKYKDGTINVESVKDNYIQYVMSDNISKYFIVGQALSDLGKALDRSGYISGDLPPKEMKAKYEKGYKALEKIALKIKDDKYKTKEDIVKDIYKQVSGLNLNTESGKYYRSEFYYGNVKGLIVYFAKERKTKEFTFTVPVTSDIEGYNLVWDKTETHKLIVDNKGKVIVDTGLKDVVQINSYYYQQLNYYDDMVLRLNVEKSRLDTVKPYRSSNVSYLTGELVLLSYRGKYGVLDKNGSLVIPAIYHRIETTEDGGAIIASDKGSFKLFNLNADLLFEGQGSIGAYSEGLAIYRNTGGKNIGFIDKQGKIVLPLSQYEDVKPFTESLAVAEKNGKWGCIRKDGSVAIPFVYDEIRDFSHGVTLVKKDDLYGLVNIHNEFVVPLDKTGGYSISENFGKRSYYMNGQTYDEKGRLKKEE